MLSLLKHAGEVWNAIAEEFAAEGGAYDVHLEYTVEPPHGRGCPSHTDVMVLNSRCAFAVEAKSIEPGYDTVGQWLGRGRDPDNRRAVLKGWLSLLEPFSSRPLQVEDFSGAVYQMLHRAASACATGRAPALAYLCFVQPRRRSPDRVAGLKYDLAHLRGLLGNPASFPMHLIELAVEPTPSFGRIENLPKGSAETGTAVRDALLGPPLLEFPEFRLHRVQGGSCA